jgi:hypothetical protein
MPLSFRRRAPARVAPANRTMVARFTLFRKEIVGKRLLALIALTVGSGRSKGFRSGQGLSVMAGSIPGSSPGTAMTENRKLDDRERPPTASAIRARLLTFGIGSPPCCSPAVRLPGPRVGADDHDRLRAVQPRGRCNVPRLIEKPAIKLTDLPVTLAGCPKGQSTNIDDRCKADYERRRQLNSEPI